MDFQFVNTERIGFQSGDEFSNRSKDASSPKNII